MSFWLLAPMTLALLAEARMRCADHSQVTAWEQAELRRDEGDEDGPGQLPRIMTIAGSTAEIRVEGVLTKRPDFFAAWFGGGNTTYTSIRSALAIATTDPKVKTIVLAVDSPGGAVDGLFETLDAIAAARANSGKTMRVRADNALSAAYGIAAAGGSIEAAGRGSSFGSIGAAVSFFVDPAVVTLTNTDSPDKRPDVTTDEGKAVIVAYLDQIHDELVRAIARGRDVKASAVNDTYGRGASFIASHALNLGMIDKIASTPLRAVSNRNPKSMSEEQTPESRAEASRNTEAAVQRGVAQERDRVVGHLTLGENCGDLSIALEAIRSGAGMTHELNARYMSAGMNRADRSTRQAEGKAAEAAVAGAPPVTPATADLGDQVVALLKAPSDRSFVRG
jgi:ClpP class serine protease